MQPIVTPTCDRLVNLVSRWSAVEPIVQDPEGKAYTYIDTPESPQLIVLDTAWITLAIIQARIQNAVENRGLRLTQKYDGSGYHTTIRTINNAYYNNAYDEFAAISLLSAYVPYLEAIAALPPHAS